MSLGERIGLARANTSKTELARRIGVDTKTVYRWEHGDARPASEVIVPLADALGVSVRWLLTGEGEGPADQPILAATGTDDAA